MEGTCAAIVTKKVIPYELGVLPTEPKDETPVIDDGTTPTAAPSKESSACPWMTFQSSNTLFAGLVLAAFTVSAYV